jgi:hypothetical protein
MSRFYSSTATVCPPGLPFCIHLFIESGEDTGISGESVHIAHRSFCSSSHLTGVCLWRVGMGLIRRPTVMFWIGWKNTSPLRSIAALRCCHSQHCAQGLIRSSILSLLILSWSRLRSSCVTFRLRQVTERSVPPASAFGLKIRVRSGSQPVIHHFISLIDNSTNRSYSFVKLA